MNVSTELGGNAPFVVTADVDLDAAVDGAMIAKFRNSGQACTAANRFYAQELPTDSKGNFFASTVLTNVPPDARIIHEEILGPVAPIVHWRHENELLRMVNESEQDLAAYVHAGDLRHAIRLGEAIDAGMVGINRGLVSEPSAPFGGVEQSGLGREGACDGLHEYLETQYLAVGWPASWGRSSHR